MQLAAVCSARARQVLSMMGDPCICDCPPNLVAAGPIYINFPLGDGVYCLVLGQKMHWSGKPGQQKQYSEIDVLSWCIGLQSPTAVCLQHSSVFF